MDASVHKTPGPTRRTTARRAWLAASSALAGSLALALGTTAFALPQGGVVVAGSATIAGAPGAVTINQASQNTAINWQSFGIGQTEAVQFVQPNASSVALNRVLGSDPSTILGRLSANGHVFLVNPNGVLFGSTAQVSVGGLVASTLAISDADFMAGQYRFTGSGTGAVTNHGALTADGGSVVLMGAQVSNQGVISARLGSVSLAAGAAMTLDVTGDGLLNVAVNEGALDALAENGGLIRADGGQVFLTARSVNGLLRTAVNNSGVIEARTLENRKGVIVLMGDLVSGDANLTGTLDASALNGGDGGFIETSAANVRIADSARVTTYAPQGATGTWLIDPQDFTIAAGGNISGAALSALLVTSSVVITTQIGPDATTPGTPPVRTLGTSSTGNGDIHVNEAVAWTATPSTTTLTLNAERDVNVNQAITATNGNLVICCGRDANVNAAVTTTNGSVLIAAGRNANVNGFSAITVTDGNLVICAGENINISGAMTLTRGSTIPSQSLGLATGMTLNAGYSGTGPGAGGGTVTFGASAPPVTVTGPNAPVTINYNPVSYSAPTDFLPRFTLTGGSTLTQRMLVFPNGSRVFDGGTATTLTGFNTTTASGALPSGLTLVAGPGATATYDSAAVGSNIGITYSGYSLGGPEANRFALAQACCTTTLRTTGTISAAPAPTPTPTPVPTPTPTPVPVPTPTPTPVPVPTPTPTPVPVPTPTPTPVPVPTPTPTPVPVPTPTPTPVPVPVPTPTPTPVPVPVPTPTPTPVPVPTPTPTPVPVPVPTPTPTPVPVPTPTPTPVPTPVPVPVPTPTPTPVPVPTPIAIRTVTTPQMSVIGPVAAAAAAGIQLAVMEGGVRMPLIPVVEVPAPQPQPVVVPQAPAPAPAPYVAPVYAPKQDRN